MSVLSFCAPRLNDHQLERWRTFIRQCPSARYTQDPLWGEVERRGTGLHSRRPHFFWCEQDGRICLTAIGVRRRLPIPGRVFWEFENGPNVLEPTVLDAWLGWLLSSMGRETARLIVQPAMLLDEIGDQMETVLDARGFARRRTFGVWSSLVVDLDRTDDQMLGSFHRKTRRTIRQAENLGVVVAAEDSPEGWSALAALDAEMAARAPVRPIDPGFVKAISRHWFAGGARGTVLVARHQGQPLAAQLLVTYGSTSTGRVMPSSRRHTNVPTSHLLLWEAMRWAKARGCTEYDTGGYSFSARPGEPLWGVNTFKRGFAPKQKPLKFVAVHERVFSPLIVSSAITLRRFQTWSRLTAGSEASREDACGRGEVPRP